jgi:hypothetical protein
LNVDHAQLRKIIYTGTKTRHRKSNLRNKGQYHLSSEKHVIMIINCTEKSEILPMSVIIFFSAIKKYFFCRNDVQAIDFLRKGSYAPASIQQDKSLWKLGVVLFTICSTFQIWRKLPYKFSLLIKELRCADLTAYKTTLMALVNSVVVSNEELHDRQRVRSDFVCTSVFLSFFSLIF